MYCLVLFFPTTLQLSFSVSCMTQCSLIKNHSPLLIFSILRFLFSNFLCLSDITNHTKNAITTIYTKNENFPKHSSMLPLTLLLMFICKMSSISANLLTTASGHAVPIIYGTAWKKERTAELVVAAVLAGFRAIDTACQPKHYAEEQVGQALQQLHTRHGISRADLFVQTKFTSLGGQDPARIPYDQNAPLADQIRESCAKSLANLQTDYLDSLLLHGPMRSLPDNLLVWRVFEELHAQGKTRSIGLSNFYDLPLLRAVFEEARVKPAVLQNRFYAETGHDREVREFCKRNGIVYQSFWTLTANPHALRSPIVQGLAKKRNATAEQIFFRFTMDIGITPLSGTTNKTHMEQDVAVAGMAPLSADEIRQIETVLYGD